MFAEITMQGPGPLTYFSCLVLVPVAVSVSLSAVD